MNKTDMINRISRAGFYIEDVCEGRLETDFLKCALDILSKIKEELKEELETEENEG